MNCEVELTKGIDPLYLARRLVLIIDGEMAIRKGKINGVIAADRTDSEINRFQVGSGNNFWIAYYDSEPGIVIFTCRTGYEKQLTLAVELLRELKLIF